MSKCNGIFCVFLLVFCALAGGVSRAGGMPHPVQVRLLADVDAVVPGQAFYLGVQLRMEEGWHTYWQFSGDTGAPTTVAWELPPGFSTGPLEWPLPSKYTEGEDLVVYGYGEPHMLLAQVRVPEPLDAAAKLPFKAEVSWLVCRELCYPSDTTLVLEMPVSLQAKSSPHAALFAESRARLPVALEERSAIELDYAVQRQGNNIQVDIVLAGRDRPLRTEVDSPDFYPINGEFIDVFAPPQLLELGGEEALAPGIHATPLLLRLQIETFGQEHLDVLRGVLVYQLEGDTARRYNAVELELDGKLPPGAESGGLLAINFKLADADRAALSLWVYLALAAVGGLILNLMPCVLPVISLKVLSFVSQAGEERGRIRQLGLAFVLGILATFMALALVVISLKAGGEQIGWGFQFQYPGFVMAMAALVFALGLSLFGVFSVRLPGAQGGLGGAGRGEGLFNSFANGVLATVLATPCTAPFLGTALGFAFSRSAFVISGIFLCIGLGMALPYILLALEPGWMRFIPRPGLWMERFKQLMGFLLMATVLWLLWVLGKQLGMEGVVWSGAFLLCLALSCWIVGQWIDLRSRRPQRLLGWGVAVALTIFGYGAFLQPLLGAEEILAAVKKPKDELPWQPFSVSRVESLVKAEKNVFIDFTAEWCWTCKVNERTVLAEEVVQNRFAAMDMALVKADWTNRNPEITALLQAFGRSGVPLYVILPAGQADRPIVLPEVITTGILLENLEEAASRSRQRTY